MSTSQSNEKSYNDAEIVNYYSDFIKAGLFRYEEMLVDKYFVLGGNTLDVGCGAGRVTIPLYRNGYRVIGMDYSAKMIEEAKRLNPEIDYQVGNILQTKYGDDEFDNIIFSFNGLMLLESYDDRLAATKEIRRLLNADGKFIFTTPFLDNKVEKSYWTEKATQLNIDRNAMTWEQQLALGDEELEDYDNEFFLHVPFVSEIRRMLDEAGMEILFSARRLDFSGIEKMEDELDDNYLWVAECKR
ncbi:MAG: methyltransferase domain-containing protein [Lachnospiraceae bacterium]|nr:methyltransferase domain-containing protein [Lachnospiraceae bacterium]